MKFRTEVTATIPGFRISHPDKIMLSGSCFVENISSRMQQAGFTLDVNPFGVVYNPFSLAGGLQTLISCKKYAIDDLFEYQGIFHSPDHHGRFSDVSVGESLERINRRIQHSSGFLRQSSVLIVTFGTAFVYRLKSNGQVVSNCHKLPDHLFVRSRLSVSDIVEEWERCVRNLREINSSIRIIFTVSPIRHVRDGMHENQLSKSTLLLAADELVRRFPDCAYYFPSYEIQIDELRDYRFYAEDMVHPSSVAVDFIWEKFSGTLFSEETLRLIDEWQKIQQALNHKPFHPDSAEYQAFLRKIQAQKDAFCKKNPSFS